MNGTLALSSLRLSQEGCCSLHVFAERRPSLASRLARLDGRGIREGACAAMAHSSRAGSWRSASATRTSFATRASRRRSGASSGQGTDRVRVPVRRACSVGCGHCRRSVARRVLVLAVAGFFVPDLLLRHEVQQRREAIFLDLPEALPVLALALGPASRCGRRSSSRRRDSAGPLGDGAAPGALPRPPRARARRAGGACPGVARGG